jgi:hypothetical protein
MNRSEKAAREPEMDTHGPGEEVERLYSVFAAYADVGRDFCAFCNTPEEVQVITQTPLRDLDEEPSRRLLWETADHWESAEVYRHYLPRCLEILGPPWRADDLYPLHVFETLIALGFHGWPGEEQAAIIDYLEHADRDREVPRSREDRQEIAAGIASLRTPGLALPSPDALKEHRARDDD